MGGRLLPPRQWPWVGRDAQPLTHRGEASCRNLFLQRCQPKWGWRKKWHIGRTSRGANNCVQCVFDKNKFLIIFPLILNSYCQSLSPSALCSLTLVWSFLFPIISWLVSVCVLVTFQVFPVMPWPTDDLPWPPESTDDPPWPPEPPGPPESPDPPWPPESPDPPWPPKSPDPPWPPESPDLPWLPELPAPLWVPEWALASRAPTPLPIGCYTAREVPVGRGGV